jgi:archaeal preflagellin peptidase FlaK
MSLLNVSHIISISIIAVISFFSFYTDLKYGLILNKHILFYIPIVIVLNYILYVYINRISYVVILHFCINLILGFAISYLLYKFSVWGAGDAKLFSVILFSIPPDFLICNSINVFPGFTILSLSFGIAFLYVIFDTTFLYIKNIKNAVFKVSFTKDNLYRVSNFFSHYLCSIFVSLFTYSIIELINASFLSVNRGIVLILNICIVICIYRINQKKLIYFIDIASIAYIIYSIIKMSSKYPFVYISLVSIIPVVAIYLIRQAASKYNIKELCVDDLRENMTLTAEAAIVLTSNRIKGVSYDFEKSCDLKLSSNDIQFIKNWKKSKVGKDKLTIVRQIPFAPFICLSALLFSMIRLLAK